MKITGWILLLFVSIAAQAQDFTGSWYGVLDVGVMKLNISFHIKDSNHVFYTKMDSPDQKAFGIKMEETIINNDSIMIKSPKLNITFRGKWMNENNITGGFEQGAKYQLNLNRTKPIITAPKRPQTPKPPYSYKVLDTIYFNTDKTIQYGATLTYPQGLSSKKYPTLILITGSGQQDRDETIFNHKPFAVIADYLTQKGYAVLRIDDRGVGKTTGNVTNATSLDFAKDVKEAIRFLKTLPMVNIQKIGLLGHSEGGMIAPIAAADNKDVAFIISLAGLGVNGKKLLVKQNKDILESNGISKVQADAFGRIFSEMMDIALKVKDTTIAFQNGIKAYQSWAEKNKNIDLSFTEIKNDADRNKFIKDLVTTFQSPWMHYFLSFNPSPYWQKVKVPVLALNGSKDIQVDAAINIKAIQEAFKKGKNKNLTTHIFPGLNHLFQHCKTCTVPEYNELEQTIAPEVLTTINEWLIKTIGK